MRIISSTALLTTLLSVAPRVLCDSATPTSTTSPTAEDAAQQLKPLVIRGNVLLTAGQFADAAKTYSEAIELSPTDYLLYFKRATAYLSQNRHAPALDDFDTVLKLTDGSFDGAVIAKAKIFAKEGRWSEGKDMLTQFSKKNPEDKAAQELMFSISDGEVASKKATSAQKSGRWDACIESSTAALQIAAYSSSLRQQRADCALASGDVEQAIADMTRLTHLGMASTPLLLRIAGLSYFLSPSSPQGLATLKQCLHFDPDSKPCKGAHKQLKALDKLFAKLESAGEDWRTVARLVSTEKTGLAAKYDEAMGETMKGMDPPLPANVQPLLKSPRRAIIWRAACKAFVQLNEIRKGERWCNELLRMDPEDVDALVGAGEAALKKEEWDDAVRYFDKAFNASGKTNHDIHGRLQKAHRLLKQAKKKDYYKVLGVSRDADLKTVKRAYRKAAMSAHPDKGGSETKMAQVNEAYEVLANTELRQRYDNGEDPNDPESQQGGHPFHGSPFQFFQQGGGGGGARSPFGQGQNGHFEFKFGG